MSGSIHSEIPQWVFNRLASDAGFPINLRNGVDTRIFAGQNLMLSFVTIAPHTPSLDHSHPEEQWGILLGGECVRRQHGEERLMKEGDIWFTPSNTPHGISTGQSGAQVLDIFAPPRTAYLPES
jgi:quercetin dioxygenase-like cupin family protein